MAFIILTSDDGGEIVRQALDGGPVVVGRSPECALSVRDVRMSRQHCRLEPIDGGWAIADLGSKNGTLLWGQPIKLRKLEDGDVLLLGRTRLTYHAGPLIPASAAVKKASASKSGRRRPVDPNEAMSATMDGLILDFYPHQGAARPVEKLPVPAPRPADPDSYASDGVYSMLTELVSSSWDSIYASNARPAAVKVAGQERRRPAARPAPAERRQAEASPAANEPGPEEADADEPALPAWAKPMRSHPRSAIETQAKMQLQADPAEVATVDEAEPSKSVDFATEPRRTPRPLSPHQPGPLGRWQRLLHSFATAGRRVGRVAGHMIRLIGPALLMSRLVL
jgi:predicted component of type VI protein secretion system